MIFVVVLIIIVFYFLILFIILYIVGRKVDNEGFFVGNCKLVWYVVVFVMIGFSILGVIFVLVLGMVGISNFLYL